MTDRRGGAVAGVPEGAGALLHPGAATGQGQVSGADHLCQARSGVEGTGQRPQGKVSHAQFW